MPPEKLLSEQKQNDQEFTQKIDHPDAKAVKTTSSVIEDKADVNKLVWNVCEWDNWHSESAI